MEGVLLVLLHPNTEPVLSNHPTNYIIFAPPKKKLSLSQRTPLTSIVPRESENQAE